MKKHKTIAQIVEEGRKTGVMGIEGKTVEEISQSIQELLEKSREAGFSTAFTGDTPKEQEENFYLGLGLDKNGNVRASNEKDDNI